MSDTADHDFLLHSRGETWELGAYVVGVAFCRATGAAGFGLGDGTLHIGGPGGITRHQAHKGAVLSLCADVKSGFLTGGDDGKLACTAEATEVLAEYGSRWVEHVAAHPGGIRAASVGRALHLLDGQGGALKSLAHPSTVAGIAIDPKGKRIAASHYNGASLWFIAAKEDKPKLLEWKGSHAAIDFSPDGTHLVTAMQEMSLHGWRLADGQHMRMSGYPTKTHFVSFTAKGRWLATSGAESVVLWPFHGGGPMGKAPMELAGGDGVMCTAVASHPQHEVVAAGFDDGLVLIAEVASGKVVPVAPPGNGAVTALGWNATGGVLGFGTDRGFAGVVDLGRG